MQYFCMVNIVKFIIKANMATKIQQILESHPNSSLFFGNWLTKQGLNSKEQHSYMKRGWLTRISKGVYALKGKSPTLLQTVAAYNSQLDKQCIVGAYISPLPTWLFLSLASFESLSCFSFSYNLDFSNFIAYSLFCV